MGRFSRGRPAAIIVLLLLITVVALGCGGMLTTGQTAVTPPASSQEPASTQPPAAGDPAATTQAVTGSPGAGDPFFPSAGNGGYDVQSYEISLDIDPASGRIAGTDVITATALQDLAGFYLDLMGLDVSGVQVDGGTASWERNGQELKITSPATLAKDDRFTVAISYSGVPTGLSSKLFAMGWQKVDDSIFTSTSPRGRPPGSRSTTPRPTRLPTPFISRCPSRIPRPPTGC